MLSRQLPAIAVATMLVLAVAGVQVGFGADANGWSSSLRTGDVVARGTVWKVTVTTTPDEVDFWASGRVIATDTSAPFETPLDLEAGDYKLGFCHRKDGVQKCETTESGDGTGIVARVTVTEASPPAPTGGTTTTPPPSSPTTTTTPTSPTPTGSAPLATGDGWSSSLRTGDVVARGTVWKVTVTTTPDEVDFWASGRVIATDTSAPFETPLDLEAGDYKLGFCHRKDGVQKCETTESGDGTGIVARVTVTEASPPAPTGGTTTTATPTPPTGESSTTTSSTRTDSAAPKPVRRIDVTNAQPSSVSVQWPSSRDNVGVAGYGVYLDGRTAGLTQQTSYLFQSLACGTGYTVGVDAFDVAGNRSTRTSTTVSTSACRDLSPPLAPTAVRLAAATESSVVLSWQASSDNIGVVGYGLYVGGFRVGFTSEPAATLTSLSCGRSYEVGIDAVDAAGNRSARASSYFSTSPCPGDKTAPSQPNRLAVGAATTTSITLSWVPSTDDTGVSGYGLYRGSTRVATSTQTTATFSGLTCGTGYQLGVDAVDVAGNRSAVASVSASTQPCAPIPPAGGWSSSLKTGDVVPRGTVWQVTVTPVPDEVDFWASDSVIATDASAPFEVPLDLLPGDYKLGFCHRKDGVQKCATTESGAGEGIVARVTVVDSPAPTTTTNDTTRPTVPGSLRVVSAGATSVNVAWSASTDNTGVTGYGLYRGSTRVDTSTQTTATFSGLTCGAVYQLGVDAVDAAGNRSAVSFVSASTQPCAPTGDTVAPSTPSTLRVVTAAATSLNMSWSASTDNVGVAGYGQYRGSSRVGTTSQTAATFNNLVCGTAYQLGVDAYDGAGNRSSRADLTATTSACPDTHAPSTPTNLVVGTRTGTSIALSWSPSTDDVGTVGYGVYRGGARVSTTSGTTGIVNGLTCGTNYTLGVDAYDAAGNRSVQALVIVATTACLDTQAPSAPTGLAASGVTQTALTLGWTAATDNVGVTGYIVSRNGSVTGQATSTSYSITGLACGTTSTFDVQARDAVGNISPKATLQVSTAACSSAQAAASVYLSPSGSDSAACTSAAPCRSVQRGFQVAQAGQTVTLAAGEYGTQALQDAHKTVTFKGNGAHFTYLSLTCTTGITIDGINSTQITVLAGNDNITVKGGRFGGGSYRADEEKDPIVLGDVGSCSRGDVSNGITLDGVYVGEYMYPNGNAGSAHPDCLQFYGGTDGVTIRNSTFQRCEDSFIGAFPDFGDIRNVTVENNTFLDLGNRTYWASQWGQPGHPGRCDGITFRGNTFDPNNPGGLSPYSSLRTECWNMTIEGNTFKGNGPGSDSCTTWKAQWNATWRNNTFLRSGACSTG